MSSNVNDFLRAAIQGSTFRGSTFPTITNIYVALLTTLATHTSTGSTIVECTGGAYARIAVPADTSHWTLTGNVITNANDVGGPGSAWDNINFTGLPVTVVGIALCSASSGGNVFWQMPLTNARTLSSGDQLTLKAGQISLTLDT